MIMVIVAAMLGVLVGLFAKRRVFAIPLAVVAAVALHGLAILTHTLIDPQGPFSDLRDGLAVAAGMNVSSLLTTFTAAGAGSILAALLWSMVVGLPTNEFWFPSDAPIRRIGRDGRFVRDPGMVEDRPMHTAAKARLDDLLQR